MNDTLNKFLGFMIFCSTCLLKAEPGVPEWVFDKQDPEMIVGIRLNLPNEIVDRIKHEHLNDEYPEPFKGTQEEFEKAGNEISETPRAFTVYVLQAHQREDLFVPDSVLMKDFYSKLKGIYNNGDITCCCGIGTYWAMLERMLALVF